MPLVLLRFIAGRNFPPGQSIHFTAFWCDDEGHAGPVKASGSSGHVKIFEEIAFLVEADDQRLKTTTTVCLCYDNTKTPFNKAKPQFVAQFAVDFKTGITQKFCVFPTLNGVSPFVEVHFGLESLFIQTSSTSLVNSETAQNKTGCKKQLVETKVPNWHWINKLPQEKKNCKEQHCHESSISYPQSTEQKKQCSVMIQKIPRFPFDLQDESLSQTSSSKCDEKNMQSKTSMLSEDNEQDFKLFYDSSMSESFEKLSHVFQPALAGLSDSGWGDGSEDDEPDFLNLKFQKSYYDLIKDVFPASWNHTKEKIEDRINSLD